LILRLNILHVLTIALSFAFQILLLRVFGASALTDQYFLSLAAFQFISGLVSGLFLDIYIPVYSELKTADESSAKSFAAAVFVSLLVISLVITIILFVIAPGVIGMFATGYSTESILQAAAFFRVILISLVFTVLSLVLTNTLNANLMMQVSYASNLILPLSNLAALFIFADGEGMWPILYAFVIGSMGTFLFLMVVSRKRLGWAAPRKESFTKIIVLLRENAPIRAGNLVYALRAPLTANALSYLPVGSFTIYNYCDKLLNTLFNVSNSPSLQLFYVRASQFLPAQRKDDLARELRSTVEINTYMFLSLVVVTSAAFVPLFGWFFSRTIPQEQLHLMYMLFLSLTVYYFILTHESPLVYLTFGLKKGMRVLGISIGFVVLYAAFLFVIPTGLGIFVIPLALTASQIHNILNYSSLIHRYGVRVGFLGRSLAVNSPVLAIPLLVNILQPVELSGFVAALTVAVGWFLLTGKRLGAVYRRISE